MPYTAYRIAEELRRLPWRGGSVSGSLQRAPTVEVLSTVNDLINRGFVSGQRRPNPKARKKMHKKALELGSAAGGEGGEREKEKATSEQVHGGDKEGGARGDVKRKKRRF
jgi:hypothetical protein